MEHLQSEEPFSSDPYFSTNITLRVHNINKYSSPTSFFLVPLHRKSHSTRKVLGLSQDDVQKLGIPKVERAFLSTNILDEERFVKESIRIPF